MKNGKTIAGLTRAAEISKQYRKGFDATAYGMAQASALRALEKLIDDEINREMRALDIEIACEAEKITVNVNN